MHLGTVKDIIPLGKRQVLGIEPLFKHDIALKPKIFLVRGKAHELGHLDDGVAVSRRLIDACDPLFLRFRQTDEQAVESERSGYFLLKKRPAIASVRPSHQLVNHEAIVERVITVGLAGRPARSQLLHGSGALGKISPLLVGQPVRANGIADPMAQHMGDRGPLFPVVGKLGPVFADQIVILEGPAVAQHMHAQRGQPLG